MATVTRCPNCRQGVVLKDLDEQGRVKCWSCGDWVQIATEKTVSQPVEKSSSPTTVTAKPSGKKPAKLDDAEETVATTASSRSADDHDEVPLVAEVIEDDEWNPSSNNDVSADDDDAELAALEALQSRRESAKRAKKTKSETGNGKKKPKKAASSASPLAALKHPAAIGGLAIAAMLMIALGAWAVLPGKKAGDPNNKVAAADQPPGDGRPAPGNAQPAAGAKKSKLLDYPSVPVMIDKPVAGAEVAAAAPPKPLFRPAPPFDEATALTRVIVEPEPKPDPNVKVVVPDEIPSKAVWQAESDPRPAELRYTIAANLRLELKGPGTHQGISSGDQRDDRYPSLWLIGANSPPVLADQQGPYVIVPPVWEHCPFGRGWKPPKNKLKEPNGTFVSIEKPQKPIPVLDLRTGESVGEFDWRAPVFRNPALSPDGKYLVGPYPNPVVASQTDKPNEEELEQRHSFYVWERDSKKAPKKLAMPGLVACMRFISPTTIAILVEQPKRQLQLWNVADAKKIETVDLPLGPPTPSKDVFPYMYTDTDRTDLLVNFPRAMEMMAISPGGRYAAVAGVDGVSLVSLTDHKILGTLELKNPALVYEDYLGMTFMPEGDELALAVRTREGKTRFLACRVADGTIRRQHVIGGQARGPLWVNPDRQSFVLTDFPGGTQWTHPKPPAPLLFDLDKPDAERFMYRWTTPEHMAPVILRMPEEGPVLIIQEPGYMHTMDLTVSTVMAVDRDSFRQDIDKKIAINEQGLPKRPIPVEPDRSMVQISDAQPPAEWASMPPVMPAKPFATETMGRVPWPQAWSEKGALSLMSSRLSTEGFRTVYFEEVQGRLQTFDDPIAEEKKVLLPWAVRPENLGWTLHGNGGLPVGLQADGARIVTTDPQHPGRVRILDRGAEGKVTSFSIQKENPQPVVWTDFDGSNRVLAISGGELSCWDVSDAGVRGVFALRGGYTSPAIFSGDRSVLAVSRGGSLDLIDVATGKVMNRCGVGAPGVVIDAALSPDGKQLAVLLATVDGPLSVRVKRGEVTKECKGLQLALWDLSTGKAEIAEVPLAGMALLSWITPEHLGVVSYATTIYDLKLRRASVTCNYTTSNSYPQSGFPINVSPDGRIWVSLPQSEAQPDAFTHQWQASMLSRPLSEELRPYFAADRVLYDLRNTPIQIRIDLGDKTLGTTHGQALASSLQKLGCQIGGGGMTFDITATVRGTGEFITFEKAAVEVPIVAIEIQLLSPKGELVWSGGWGGSFPGERSKYMTKKIDYETRVRNGGSTFYDFQGRDPTKAMVEEILQTMRPITIDPRFPAQRFFGDGRFVEVEKTVSWDLTPIAQ